MLLSKPFRRLLERMPADPAACLTYLHLCLSTAAFLQATVSEFLAMRKRIASFALKVC
jgi:hypothetical protein